MDSARCPGASAAPRGERPVIDAPEGKPYALLPAHAAGPQRERAPAHDRFDRGRLRAGSICAWRPWSPWPCSAGSWRWLPASLQHRAPRRLHCASTSLPATGKLCPRRSPRHLLGRGGRGWPCASRRGTLSCCDGQTDSPSRRVWPRTVAASACWTGGPSFGRWERRPPIPALPTRKPCCRRRRWARRRKPSRPPRLRSRPWAQDAYHSRGPTA